MINKKMLTSYFTYISIMCVIFSGGLLFIHVFTGGEASWSNNGFSFYDYRQDKHYCNAFRGSGEDVYHGCLYAQNAFVNQAMNMQYGATAGIYVGIITAITAAMLRFLTRQSLQESSPY